MAIAAYDTIVWPTAILAAGQFDTAATVRDGFGIVAILLLISVKKLNNNSSPLQRCCDSRCSHQGEAQVTDVRQLGPAIVGATEEGKGTPRGIH